METPVLVKPNMGEKKTNRRLLQRGIYDGYAAITSGKQNTLIIPFRSIGVQFRLKGTSLSRKHGEVVAKTRLQSR